MADEDEWLDAEAAARYINLPVCSVYRLIHDGRLEAVRFRCGSAATSLTRA